MPALRVFLFFGLRNDGIRESIKLWGLLGFLPANTRKIKSLIFAPILINSQRKATDKHDLQVCKHETFE